MFSDTVHVSTNVMAQPIATRLIATPRDIFLFKQMLLSEAGGMLCKCRRVAQRLPFEINAAAQTLRYFPMLMTVPTAPRSAPAAQFIARSGQIISENGIRS